MVQFHRWVALCAVALAGAPGLAQVNMIFSLDGQHANPPVKTPGHGGGTVRLDPLSGGVQLTGEYHDLLGQATEAHIHGRASGMAFLIPLQITGGVDGTVSLDAVTTPSRMSAILAGSTLVNIHTQLYPDGEIAGFIVAPEPSAATIGACLLLLIRRFPARRPASVR